MSSEFERRLREGRETLPEPDAATTERARERAIAAIRRRSTRSRTAGLVVVAVVLALGIGIGVGSLIAPSGTAARGPVGLGFLPEPDWFVLQSGPRSVPGQPAVAIAANVPFHRDDDVRGLAESSALPYSTLQTLPPGGVVIAAAFSPRGENPFADPYFPKRSLPLRVRDAVATGYGSALRDREPLGQYHLRAAIDDHNVDVHIYFGVERPSRAHLAEAQRQLDRLVVGSASEGVEVRQQARAAPAASRVIDRTVVCSIMPGNPREIDVQASSGTRPFGDRSKWKSLPSASFGDPRSTSPTSSHVYAAIRAGWPPPREVGLPLRTDTLSYSITCRPSRARVPLSAGGLSGGAAGAFGDDYDCVVPRKILVRIRGLYRSATTLKRSRDSLVARGAVREGYLAVRTPSGKQIALATVFESGKARLFVGDTCAPSG